MDLKLTESRSRGGGGRMSRMWMENGLRGVCVWETQWEVIQTKQSAFLNKDQ